jgi:hypothetical protein
MRMRRARSWPQILSNLKTLRETGRTLPAPRYAG